jgi:membrane protein YqaA with SNARE-associated domain
VTPLIWSVSGLDYFALFASALLAATILPFASEVPLAVMVRQHDQFALPVAVATAGNFLGACTTYVLARSTLPHLLKRTSRRTRVALELVQRYGPPALVLSWVPLAGDAIVVVAGASGMRFTPFAVWTVLGKAARYVVVAWLVLRG